MKMNSTKLFTLGIFLFSTVVFSQENVENNNSIDQQFDDLMESSNNYRQYEVVEKAKLLELQDNARIKISGLENKIATSKGTIGAQKEVIDQLNAKLDKTTASLNQAVKAHDEILFFGVPTTKSTYRAITWGALIILLVVLAIFVIKFRNGHVQTKDAKYNLQQKEEEFEEYRKKALEKQQKLGRSLQDERNKSTKNSKKGSP